MVTTQPEAKVTISTIVSFILSEEKSKLQKYVVLDHGMTIFLSNRITYSNAYTFLLFNVHMHGGFFFLNVCYILFLRCNYFIKKVCDRKLLIGEGEFN